MARDDVGGGLGVVPGVLQGASVGFGLIPGLFQLLLYGGLFRLHSAPALLQLPVLGGESGGFRPGVGGCGHGHSLPAPKGLRLGLLAPRLGGGGPGLFQKGLQALVQLLQPPGQALRPVLLLGGLGRQAPGPAVGLHQLRLGPVNVLLVVGDAGFQHRHGGGLVLRLGVQLPGLRPDLLRLHVLLAHFLAKALPLGIEGIQGGPGLVPLLLGGVEVHFQLPGADFQRVQVFQPHGDFQHPQLVPQDEIFFRLFRLVPQGLHLKLQLGDLVVDADQVFLRPLQLPLRLLLPVAKTGNPGGLLEDLPALAAPGGEDFVDFALADDGIALPPKAGVQKQLRHVLEPDGLAVDVVFALPAAVIPAGDGHLRLLHGGEDALRVVQHQRHLGKAHLVSLLRAAEDDVLHLRAPEALGALFAHDPADGVGDIGFSRAVGAHDGGDILPEVQDGLIREGLKALNFQRF